MLLEKPREALAFEAARLTPGVVKVRLHRARLRLREALSGYLVSPLEADDEGISSPA